MQRDQLVGNTLEANRVYATKLAETTQNFLLAAQQELATPPPGSARVTSIRHRRRTRPAACVQTNSFNSSLVVDADGLVIATSPQTLQLQGEILHSVGNNAALAARQPMISDPYQSTTGKLLVSLSHPIFDRQGHYRGYVSGTLYLRQRSAAYAAGQLPRRLLPVRGRPPWPPAVPRRRQAGRRLRGRQPGGEGGGAR